VWGEPGSSGGEEAMPETQETIPPATSAQAGPTMIAFLALVLIGGSNAVAVRFSNLELPPFWGAASRFLAAAAIFWVILLARRAGLPKGKALAGSILYGALAVGASYAFLYWALLEIQASFAMVILSLNPLMTMLFAAVHGIEPFRWRGLAGSLLAMVGIAIGIGAEFGGSLPLLSLGALIAGVVCIAEGSVVFKLFPGTKPLPTNVVAVTTGGLILALVSIIAGETWSLPGEPATIAAFGYLVVFGSVVLFYLYLLVLSRWTASATSYAFLLFPVATIAIAALIADERVTGGFLIGAVITLAGIWLGAFTRAPEDQDVRGRAPADGCDPPQPGCA
jgi:drug/metabolite transporter (DMT)-like permease